MQSGRWQEVKRVFEVAVGLTADERAAYLAQMCAGDAELRREVESILAAGERVPAFFDAPAVVSFADLLLSDRPEALLGRRVGAYQLSAVIASGGMGTVYRATRADEQFEQVVAVKFIKVGMVSGESLERFRAERQMLAGLDHPNIARLLDGGVTADGWPYLVMEFVDGTPVDEYCDEHRLSIVGRLGLFRTVCAAVQYAHQRLVVHRDLKPGNIFVTRDGVVKLLDFGIAKVLQPEPAPGLPGPATTLLPRMTPEYASPEQFCGGPVTTATDVYSLGVVLYELLTGQRPHKVNSRLFHELARTVCEVEPERPSTAIRRVAEVIPATAGPPRPPTPPVISRTREAQPEKLRRQLRGDVDAIVLMALRKEPQRRYASAEQFSEDIRRHLEGLPVYARHSTVRYRSAKFVRRHAAMVAAIFTVVLALVAGIIATTWTADVARRERDAARRAERLADQEKANAIVEARKAERVTKFLQKMLSSADPSNVGRDVTVREVLETAASAVASEFAEDPEVESAVRTSIGETYIGLGRYDAAEPQLRAALELQRRIHGEEHWDVANALNNLGVLCYFQRDLAGAEHYCAASLAINRKLYGDEHPSVATALNNLGVLVRSRGDPARAEQLLQEALQLRRRLHGDASLEVAETLNNLALLLLARGDLNAAEPLSREVLAIRRKLLGDDHPRVAQSLDNLASLLDAKGDSAAAEALAREALACGRKSLGDDHPEVAVTLYNLAGLLVKKEDFAGAEPLLRECLAIRERALPARDVRTAEAATRLGGCLGSLGRYEEAEPLVVQSYATLSDRLGPQHERTLVALRALVRLYTLWGKPDEAARHEALLPTSQPAEPAPP